MLLKCLKLPGGDARALFLSTPHFPTCLGFLIQRSKIYDVSAFRIRFPFHASVSRMGSPHRCGSPHRALNVRSRSHV